MGANQQYVHKIQPQKLTPTHPYFQKAYIAADEKGKFINSHIRCQQKQFNIWRAKITPSLSQTPINHDYLYLPIKTQFEYDKGYCSNTGSVVNIYPYYQSLLSSQIAQRSKEKNYFKQSQLWYLLYVLTAAKIQMNKVNERVGDIKPSNVFIDQAHKLKIGNLFTSPNQQTNYYKLINKQSDFLPTEEEMKNIASEGLPKQSIFNFLLAPEDIDEAKKDLVNNKGNYKSQIFSIGATVICAGILENLQEVYDYKKITFKQDVWKEKLNQWINHQKYSEIFKSVILNLVDKDPLKRIELQALWTFLSRYNISINGKQPFIIVNPPDCLEKGIQTVRNKKIQSL